MTPSSAAMRAARAIESMLFASGEDAESAVREVAAIIDREAGIGELVEIVKEIHQYERQGDEMPHALFLRLDAVLAHFNAEE